MSNKPLIALPHPGAGRDLRITLVPSPADSGVRRNDDALGVGFKEVPLQSVSAFSLAPDLSLRLCASAYVQAIKPDSAANPLLAFDARG